MKRWKKGMAWLLSVLCILVTVQIPSIPVKAAVSNGQIIGISADDAIAEVSKWVDSEKHVYTVSAGECVGLTQYYMQYLGFSGGDIWGGSGGTYANDHAPRGMERLQGVHPKKGDILVYTDNPTTVGNCYHAGHVAIFESDYTSYHQNFWVNNGFKRTVTKIQNRKYDSSYTWHCYNCGADITQTYWGVWRPDFQTNQRPEGAADVIEAVGNKRIHVYGWAYDPDAGASTPLEIHVYLGTESNQVETFVGKTVTSFKRENNYLGYDVTLDVPISGEKYVYVWALDSSGENNNRMIGSKKIYIPSDTTKPTISNLKVVSKNRNGYTLQCNVSDNVGVERVNFSTCKEVNGEKVWVAYKVTDIVNGTATCEIKTSDFSDSEGTYYTDIAAFDAAGNESEVIHTNYYIDRTAPVVISAEITSCDKDGYNVTATATDNVGVTVIKFPSWNSGGTEDDIVWYEGTPVVNGTSTCRINIKDMKSGNGKYWTDIRAYDADGNVSGLTSINHLPVRIDSDAPTISNVTTTKLSDTSYKVSCKVTDDNLQSVQFGTSVNGKLPVWKKVSATDGVYEAVISMDDFSMEEGDYVTTIKAIDTFGNESAMVAELVSLDAKKPLTGIALNKTEIELEKGTTETLTVSYDPADTTDSKETLWSCSDYSVATVENGVVTAVGKGNAIITVRCGRYTATCNITVTEKNVTPDPKPTEKPLTGITLNKETLELEKGATESLKVGYTPEDTTDNKDVIWTSSEETVATVTDGTITAVGKGTAIITARVGNCEASCTVKVTEEEVNPSPTDKPSPTPSEDPKPTPSEDPKPTPSEDPKPTPSEDPKPTPSEDPKPTPSVNPDPAPTDKPKPVVKPDVPADRPVSQHTHNFNWVTVQKASTTQDGLEELKCDCGMVKESSIIPASQAYVNELYQNLGKASENGEVSFDSGRIYTISDYLIKKLQDRLDVVTTITFEYDHKKYQMIIPAGADYAELLEDEEYFYGYFYFAKKVGAKVEEL